jgi:hypothetical protein
VPQISAVQSASRIWIGRMGPQITRDGSVT